MARRISIFICTVFIILSQIILSPAYAQSDQNSGEGDVASVANPKQPQVAYNGDELIVQVIKEIVQAVVAGFDKLENNAGLDDAGQTIMYMLLSVMLAWGAMKSMTGNGVTSFMEEAIVLLIMVGVIQTLLWSGGIKGIESFINSIASSIAGDDLSNLDSTLTKAVTRNFNAVLDILTMPSIESNSGWGLGKVLVAIPQTILQIFAKFIAACFLVISCGIFIANVVLAYGSIIIAKALAPILIPWLLLPSASFLFDGWLRFFLGSCMFKVVGAFFIMLTDNWISAIAKISKNVKVGTEVDALALYSGNFLIYAAIIMIAATTAYLMTMVPTIAAGIISGTNRAAFNGTAALSKGVGAGRGANGAVNKVAGDAFKAGQKLASRNQNPIKVNIGSKVS